MQLLHALYANMTKMTMPYVHGITVSMFRKLSINIMDVCIAIKI